MDTRIGHRSRKSTDRVVSTPSAVDSGATIRRVRCVIVFDERYLLAKHNSRRPASFGKWGLPGGRLKALEDPKTGIRREILEELGFRLPYLVELGDWLHRREVHRVFGCKVGRPVEWFDRDELLAIGWHSYADVVQLAEAGQLHTGFELEAITDFRDRAAGRPGSIELSRRPSKRVRGSRKARKSAHSKKARSEPL